MFKQLNKFDLTWALGLFGTAVGAGILFLPINAGIAGFYPLLLMAILVGPMTYYAHRGLARFVLSSSKPGSDITDVVEEFFGATAGKIITLLYFFAIYPILLIYGVGMTNTVESFIINQLGMSSPPRYLLSLVLILTMMSIILSGEKLMLKITEWLVYPLCIILLLLSIMLIPHWNMTMLDQCPSLYDFTITMWITIPVLVFSFNHSPAISSFAMAQVREYGQEAEKKAAQTLRFTATSLLGFVMLFVFSCVLCLSPEQLLEAKSQNISILSYLANNFDHPIISYFGPLIAFFAIASSFFGHYLGAREGLHGLIVKIAKDKGKTVNSNLLNKTIALFFILSLWLVATINPSILSLIESLGGPIIAMILFIMPVYAIKKVPAMQKYKSKSDIFVWIMGCIAISAILYSLIR